MARSGGGGDSKPPSRQKPVTSLPIRRVSAGVDNTDTIDWVEINLDQLATPGLPVPFTLIGARFKSSSSDSEDFIHDPLNVLINSGLAGIASDWRVATLVVNHEKTLSASHTYALAAAKSGGSGIVGTLIIKQPAPADLRAAKAAAATAAKAAGAPAAKPAAAPAIRRRK